MVNMKETNTKDNNRNLVVILCLLLTVILGLIVGIVLVNRSLGTKTSEDQESQDIIVYDDGEEDDASGIGADDVVFDDVVDDPVGDAKDMDGIVEKMQQAIDEAVDNESKSIMLLNRAYMMYNATLDGETKYNEQILRDAYLAEKINPTIQTAIGIHEFEKAFGDTDKAEEYLEIAKGRGYIEQVGGEG